MDTLPDTPERPGRIRRVSRWWMQSNAALMTSGVFGVMILAALLWLVAFPAPPVRVPLAVTQIPALADDPATVGATAELAVACPGQVPVDVTPEQLVLTSYTTSWYRMGTVMAPWSIAGGPAQGDPANVCFARTPEGALYAVATRNAAEARDAGIGGWRFSGYRWNSYTPELAVLTLAITAVGNEGFGTARMFTTIWQDNDWKILDPTPADTVPIDSLRTFTPWGGS